MSDSDARNRSAGSRGAKALVAHAREQTERAARAKSDAGPPGTVAIPGYEIIEELQGGGQGIVFRGAQRATGKQVAIKVLRGGAFARASDRARFEREARILGELDHPNIIGIRDRLDVDGRQVLVMDFVEGEALDAYVRGAQAPIREILGLFEIICVAVEAAHGQGIIHRDLKPSNVRVSRDGRPFVLDFGSAKAGGEQLTGPGAVTATGHFVGSLPWASPEQANGSMVDERSDVYSLGVMLYQLITGRFPYDVYGAPQDVLEAIQRTEPVKPKSINRNVDDELQTILLRCLEKEPSRRYMNAGELGSDLRRYVGGEPIAAKRDSSWYVLSKKLRRYRAAAMISMVFAALSISAAVTTVILYREKGRAEETAAARNLEVGAMDAFLNAMLRSVNSRSDAEELKFVDLLAKGEDYIRTNLQGQPLIEANLRTKLGDAYGRLRLDSEAERHLELANEIRHRELGPTHPDTLAAIGRLAQRYNASEKLDKAEQLFRESLQMQLTLSDPDHPDVVWKRMYLADVLEKRGKLDEADSLYREALDSFTRNPGDDYKNYFDAANNYLVFLVDKNRITQAEPLTRAAVATLEKHVGLDDPKTKHMLSNQARVLVRLGRLNDAATIYQGLIDDHVRQFGDKKAAGAIVMYLNNLGEILLDQHHLPEAEPSLRQAITLQERETGPDDRTLLLAKGNLACVLARKGALSEGEQLAREVLDTTKRFLGDQSGEAAEAEARIGEILLDAGNARGALPLLARAVPVIEAEFGPSDKATLLGMACWGRAERALGDLTKAEGVFRGALASCAELPSSHWIRGCLQGELGSVLLASGRWSEAEVELVSAITVLREELALEHPRTQSLIANLVAHYERDGRTEDAGRYRLLLRQ